MWWFEPLVGLLLPPAHKVGDVQLQGGFADGLADALELGGGLAELLHQDRNKGGIHRQVRLTFRPGPEPVAFGLLTRLGRSLLEAAQAVGQQAQVVALEGGQQGALQLAQVLFCLLYTSDAADE